MSRAIRQLARPLFCRPAGVCSAPHVLQKRWSQSLPTRTQLSYEDFCRRLHRKEELTILDRYPEVYPTTRRFGIVMLRSGYISEIQLGAIRALLKRVHKSERILEHVQFDIQLYKKSAGKRLGGGRGKKIHKIAWVEKGTLIIEWDHEDRMRSEKAGRACCFCLFQECKLVINPLPEFDQMLEDENHGKMHDVREFAVLKKRLDEEAVAKAAPETYAGRVEREQRAAAERQKNWEEKMEKKRKKKLLLK